jgi:hypothetical protein
MTCPQSPPEKYDLKYTQKWRSTSLGSAVRNISQRSSLKKNEKSPLQRAFLTMIATAYSTTEDVSFVAAKNAVIFFSNDWRFIPKICRGNKGVSGFLTGIFILSFVVNAF